MEGITVIKTPLLARLLAVLATAFVLGLGTVAVNPGLAHAATQVETLTVEGELGADGILTVTETYEFAGDAPATFSKRFATRENGVGDVQYVRQINQVSATVAGSPADVEVRPGEDATVVEVEAGGGPLVLTYTVRGAVRDQGDDHVFVHRVLQGLSMPVQKVTATIATPGLAKDIDCYAGPPNSTGACTMASQGTHDNPIPTFVDGPRGAGEQVTAVLPFDPSVVEATAIVEHRWTLGRAFSVGPAQLLTALGVLLIGGLVLWVLHRRTGRDAPASGKQEKVAEFLPVGDGESEFHHFGTIRPGHVGTVADERVDPIDVTAGIIDLAVRGHLRITELPREREFAPVEWTLTRRESDDELSAFEERLLDAVVEGDEPVKVSELAGRVQGHVTEIQDALYDEVVERGWYERRPDQTRNRWVGMALGGLVIAVVGTGVLVGLTSFGLLGLAFVAVALGLVFVAQEMPARTPSGAALLAGLQNLSHDLHHHATDQMPKGRELAELSEVLPYAVVLGGADRWLDAIVDADGDDDPDSTDLDWYHGPDNWHLADLPDSLRNFITTVSGRLFSR